MGNRLDGSQPLNDDTLTQLPPPDSNAYRTLSSGEFQQWQMGFQLNMPLGFRREMAGMHNAELQVTKERAKLQEGELELSHQLAFAIRDLEANYVLSETNYNRRIAAQHEVEAVSRAYENDTVTIDRVLEAQRSLAQAESDYYRSLVDYSRSITQVHLRKGSLLEYNGVYLAEGPWPAKAYFDARRRARARDAGLHFDYGFTKPEVISRGPMNQQMDSGDAAAANAAPPPAPAPGSGVPLPPPTTTPVQPGPLPQPAAPPAAPPAPPAPAAQPQASEPGRGDGPWDAAVRLPAPPVDRFVDSQVDGVSWTNPVRDDHNAVGPDPALFGRQFADRPGDENRGMAMPQPAQQPAGQLPVQQPVVQPPVQPPMAQPPVQQPGPQEASEPNPLREVAEQPVGDGQGLRN